MFLVETVYDGTALCGNRIEIPDLLVEWCFEPVHTMTGIIAQEMGEVVPGSVHYRALFMVGIMLFFISLLINLRCSGSSL